MAGVFSPALSPVTAVGGAVIDAVPPAVKDWAVALFGTADKVALLVGMALVIAGFAGLAGVVEDRRRYAGAAVVGVFGLAGLAAVLTPSPARTWSSQGAPTAGRRERPLRCSATAGMRCSPLE